MRTRIKICGITRAEDAELVAELGADAVGFVFNTQSPRRVTPEQAREVAQHLPAFVTRVGLFVDARKDMVEKITEEVGLDLLQFHGAEMPAFCRGFNKPYIKAIRMRDGIDVHAAAAAHETAAGVLLDSYVAGQVGGTGSAFDWTRVPSDLGKPLIIAGGLNPDNVARAVEQLRPYAVDVSSGVEADKGIKDAGKLKAFFEAVESAYRQ